MQAHAGEHGQAPATHGLRNGAERMRTGHADPVHGSVRAGAAGHVPGVRNAVERPQGHASSTVHDWDGRKDGGH